MLWLWRPLRARISLAVRRSTHTSANSSPVTLRPYQESALAACTDALEEGVSRIGVSLPTGSGKTTLFLSLLSRIKPPESNPTATRALVVVNAIELAQQAAAQAKRMFPEWTIEIEQGQYKASGLADVTMATWQTLTRSGRLDKFDLTKLKAVIVDEAHHAASPMYRKLLSRFHHKVVAPNAEDDPVDHSLAIPIIGVSATFSRHDGLALGSVFERIVYHHDFMSMIKDRWLSEVRFTTVKANFSLKDVRVNAGSGDFNATSLAHVVNTEAVNALVVKTYLDKAADRRSTLVFCVNLAHVRDLTQAFRDAGIDARYVYSGTPAHQRKELINSFKNGEFPVLINCNLLTEGTDIPGIDCILLARPTRSRNVFAQMIGRGMRLSPDTGKTHCRIIDFVDTFTRVVGVVSVPTLFGLDPSTYVDNKTIEELEKQRSATTSVGSSEWKPIVTLSAPRTVTYIDHENPFSSADGAYGAPHAAALSPNAWVGCGGDIYVLECLGHGFIRVEPASPGTSATNGKSVDAPAAYVAHYTPVAPDHQTAQSFKLSPFRRSRPVLTAASLADALHGCDTYATTRVVFGPQAVGLKRTAKWRSEPATPAQRKLVAAKWKVSSQQLKPEERAARIAALTKGEAGNIITKLKHGAQQRYEKAARLQEKEAMRSHKEQQRRAREHVGVGPLVLE